MSDLKPMQLGRVKPITLTESSEGVYSGDEADWDTGGSGGSVPSTDQWKQPVVAATTASITISTALNNGDTLDGVTLATGDRVLVKNQGTASQNGIYIVGTTPERAPDMDDDDEVLGALVYVIAGTANAGTVWTVTNTAATVVGTDAINWAALGGSGTITVEESDGTPSVASVDTVIFDATDFSVTDNSDGSVTVAALGGGTTITTKDEGSTLSSTVSTLDFVGAGVTASGSGATTTVTIPGGSGLTQPNIIQRVVNGNAATSLTVAAAASGHRFILLTNSTTGQITSPTCTNTTWTQLKTWTAGAAFYALWVGVVAGGSSGTSITVTKPGGFNTMAVVEVADALTPTLGSSTSASVTTNANMGGVLSLTPGGSGRIVVFAASDSNTGFTNRLYCSPPGTGFHEHVYTMLVAYTTSSVLHLHCFPGSGNGTGVVIAEIT